jgi:hypothetical protein
MEGVLALPRVFLSAKYFIFKVPIIPALYSYFIFFVAIVLTPTTLLFFSKILSQAHCVSKCAYGMPGTTIFSGVGDMHAP